MRGGGKGDKRLRQGVSGILLEYHYREYSISGICMQAEVNAASL